MIKMILIFFSLFVIFYTGIDIFRTLTGKEKIEFVKLASYSFGIATIVLLIALAIIVLF